MIIHICLSTVPNVNDTKAVIQSEASRLFAEKGYAAVSMRELADAVGVRQGGLYNHFESKQALLVGLMASHMEALIATLDEVLNGLTGPIPRLEAFVRHHVSYHLDFPNDVFLAYMEIRSLEPDGRHHVVALRDSYEGVLRDILNDGVEAGLFRISDVAVQSRMLLSMMTGATVWFRANGRLSRETVVDCHLQSALQSVGLRVEHT